MRSNHLPRICLLGLVSLAVWLCTGPAVAGAAEVGPVTPAKYKTLVDEYTNRLTLLDNEIQSLDENLAWLEIKIAGLRDAGKAVPVSLDESIVFKRNRICILKKTRGRIADYIDKVKAAAPGPQGPCGAPDNGPSISGADLREKMEAAGLSQWLELVKDPDGGFQVKTRLPILFASGSAKIPPKYTDFLKKISAFMKANRPWAVVDGFADTDPIKTRQYPSNFELGAARAANIVHALVSHGADPAMFKVASTGKYRFPDARPVSGEKAMERYVNITLLFGKG